MLTLRIKNTAREYIQDQKAEVLDVHVEILKGKRVVERRRFNFPLESTEDFIKGELKKFIDTHNADEENKKLNAKREAIDRKATETAQNLQGVSL